VVRERRFSSHYNTLAVGHPDSGSLLKGVLLGLGAALGQAAGLVMAKHAMIDCGGSVAPLEASFVRMVSALVVIWLLALMRGQAGRTVKAMTNHRAVAFSFGGAVAGPFLGVWMSLVAVKLIAAGVASTLNSMTPVLIIPLVIWYYREKVSLRALVGAVVAVGGVTLIFLG
jgi:drug/metabolite transporter (DMT)-like permease